MTVWDHRPPSTNIANLSLAVVFRIKIHVVQDHSVRRREVDPQPPRASAQQKHRDTQVRAKAVDEGLALRHRRGPVQAAERKAHRVMQEHLG